MSQVIVTRVPACTRRVCVCVCVCVYITVTRDCHSCPRLHTVCRCIYILYIHTYSHTYTYTHTRTHTHHCRKRWPLVSPPAQTGKCPPTRSETSAPRSHDLVLRSHDLVLTKGHVTFECKCPPHVLKRQRLSTSTVQSHCIADRVCINLLHKYTK